MPVGFEVKGNRQEVVIDVCLWLKLSAFLLSGPFMVVFPDISSDVRNVQAVVVFEFPTKPAKRLGCSYSKSKLSGSCCLKVAKTRRFADFQRHFSAMKGKVHF